jgi:hypothetical protein
MTGDFIFYRRSHTCLFDTVKYLEALHKFVAAFKRYAIIYPEYQPLYTKIKFVIIAVAVFCQVVYAHDLIQL